MSGGDYTNNDCLFETQHKEIEGAHKFREQLFSSS